MVAPLLRDNHLALFGQRRLTFRGHRGSDSIFSNIFGILLSTVGVHSSLSGESWMVPSKVYFRAFPVRCRVNRGQRLTHEMGKAMA